MSKFCIECGAKLPDTAKFCSSCGAKCVNSISESENTKKNIIVEESAPQRPPIRKVSMNTPTAKIFSIGGNELSFSAAFLAYNKAYSHFNKLGYKEREKFRTFWEENIKSYEDFEDKIPSYMEEVMMRGFECSFDAFKHFGRIDMPEEEFKAIASEPLVLENYLDVYYDTVLSHQNFDRSRQDIRNMGPAIKGTWVGGGFGITGAVKGAVEASLLNAGLGLINKAISTATKIADIRTTLNFEISLFQNGLLQKKMEESVDKCFHAAFNGILNVYRELGKAPVFLDWEISEEEIRDAIRICKSQIPFEEKEEDIDLICDSLEEFPYHLDALLALHDVYRTKEVNDEIGAFANFLGIDGIYYYQLNNDALFDIASTLNEPLETSEAIAKVIKTFKYKYQYDSIDGFDDLIVLLEKAKEGLLQKETEAKKKAEEEQAKENAQKALADAKEKEFLDIYSLLDRARIVFTNLRDVSLDDPRISLMWEKVARPNTNMLIEGFLCGYYCGKYFPLKNNNPTIIRNAVMRHLDNLYTCGYSQAQYIKLFIQSKELAKDNYEILSDGGLRAARLKKQIEKNNEEIAYKCKALWEETGLIQARLFYYATVHAESELTMCNPYFNALKFAAGQFFPPAMVTLSLYLDYHNDVDKKYDKYALKSDKLLSKEYMHWAAAAGCFGASYYGRRNDKITWHGNFYGPDVY